MKLARKICVLLLFASFFYCESKIISTDKIDDIEAEFAQADNETLVAFDCDAVLVEFCDNILKHPNRKKILISDYIKESKTEKSKKEEIVFYKSILWNDAKRELLSKEWPRLIMVLQSRGVKTLLLSACGGVKDPKIVKSTSEHRYKMLSKFGIDFKKSWPTLNKIIFSNFTGANARQEKDLPIFENGMLLSRNAAKGDVLKAFFAKIPQYKFKKIIFIDNSLNNVELVGKAAKDLGIEYVGVEYTRAKTQKLPPLNMKKAKKQFEVLVRERRWPSENEV
ncbi:MAG: DUF2608 domain-containing protein [Holosporaceae bacterium]|jgi:hypothetical protein|nr:DUF2608 domain-containing protein [Holosporaceae bacterium]